MDVTVATRFHPDFDDVFSNLQNGLEHLLQFVEELQSKLADQCNDIDYIRNILMPIVNTIKAFFERMVETVEMLNDQVSRDLEASIIDMKTKNDIRKKIQKDIARLKQDLKGITEAVSDAKEKCGNAKRQLSDAESALSYAKKELKDAKSNQKSAIIGGATTAILSLIILPFAPPLGAVGIAGGLGVELAGVTVMEESVKLRSSTVKTAQNEVTLSESSLKCANKSKRKIQNRLQTQKIRNNELQEYVKQIGNEIEKLHKYQIIISELNETVKHWYTKICVFYGTFNVLRCETDGGYSLAVLQQPTRDVCDAISELVRSPPFPSIYGQSRLDSLTRCLRQIENTKWASIESSYMDLI